MLFEFIFILIFHLCSTQIFIHEAHHDIKNPDIRKIEFRNFFHAELRPVCIDDGTKQIATQWNAKQLDETTLKDVKVVELEANHDGVLQLPSTFDVGLYKISIRVTSADTKCFPSSTNVEDFTYLKLIRSPLVVVVLPGNTPETGLGGITVTPNDTITLKPGYASFYRNQYSVTIERNYTKIDYYCRRVNESHPTLANDDIDNVTEVGTNGSQIVDNVTVVGTNGSQTIDNVTVAGINGSQTIDNVTVVGVNGSQTIDNVTVAGINGSQTIDNVTVAGVNGSQTIDNVTVAGVNGSQTIDNVTVAGTNGSQAIDNVTVVGTNGSQIIGHGCFNKEPGKLSFNSNSYSFPASQLGVPGAVYEFRCDVYTLDGMYSGFAYVELANSNGTSFQTFIHPGNPNVNLQYDSGIVVNAQTKNFFIGSYDENVKDTKFQWTIVGADRDNSYEPDNLISELSSYSSGVTSKKITIFPSFFSSYNQYNRFGLKFKVTPANRPSAESMVFLSVNVPPRAGTCQIVPQSGKETDLFNITCTGWTDDDGISSYTFFTKEDERIISQIYWTPTNFQTQLFIGSQSKKYIYTVWVNVTDSLGASTTSSIIDVTVSPTPVDYSWSINEMKQMYFGKSYSRLPSVIRNFAWLMNFADNNFNEENCNNFCSSRTNLTNSCLLPNYRDCSSSSDADTIINCQKSRYLCLDENHMQCIYCIPNANANQSSCQLFKKFDCDTITDDNRETLESLFETDTVICSLPFFKEMIECQDEKLSCMDDLISQRAQQVEKFISFILQSEMFYVDDIVVQTQVLSDLLQAANYSLTIDGIRMLNKIFDKANNLFQKVTSYPSSEVVQKVFDCLIKMAGILIKTINQNIRHPVNVDRLESSINVMKFYDATLPLDSDDDQDYEILSPFEFGLKSAKFYTKKAASDAATSVNLMLTYCIPILISSMNDETVYHGDFTDNEFAELLVVKNSANLLLPESRNEFVGNNFKLILPKFSTISNQANYNGSQEIALVVVHFNGNLYKFSDGLNILNGGSTDVQLVDTKTFRKIPSKVSRGSIDVFQKRNKQREVEDDVSIGANRNDVKNYVSLMKYYEINYNVSKSLMLINVTWEQLSVVLRIFIGFDKIPGINSPNYDFAENMTKSPYQLVLDDSIMKGYLGKIHIGVAQFGTYDINSTSSYWNGYLPLVDIIPHKLKANIITCRSLSANAWSADCSVAPNLHDISTHDMVHCQCDRLTTFSSGSLNPIVSEKLNVADFALSFTKNVTIFIAILIAIASWLVIAIWAHHQDQLDIMKLGVTPLPDNDPLDRYHYEIIVSTGSCFDGGTDSKVFFKLSGNLEETEIRCLTDTARPVFRRGQVNRFIMTTARPLGNLNFLHIWHDNSGKGQYASWYLNHVTFIDLQTRDKYQFVINRWLAVEEEDGKIDITVSLSNNTEKTSISYLFPCHMRRMFADYHIWLSILTRPITSRFTRVQRACCCMLMVFMNTLASALWYNWVKESEQNPYLFSFGPLSISYHEIWVGILAPLFTFPINFMLVMLFRRRRLRKTHATTVQEMIESKVEGQAIDRARQKFDYSYVKDGCQIRHGRIRSFKDFVYPQFLYKLTLPSDDFGLHLPWWIIAVAWVTWSVLFLASLIFVVYFAIAFDDYQTRRWFAAALISLLSSLFLTQPIKVALLAILYACIFKREITDDDGETDIYVLACNEQYLYDPEAPPRYVDPHIFNDEYLAHCRERRMKELKMYDVMREIAVYATFLTAVTLVTYLNRSPWEPMYVQQLTNLFVGPPHNESMKNVNTVEDFWVWADSKLAPGLRAQRWYNDFASIGQRGFLADRTSRIIGFATMRQIRANADGCIIPQPMETSVYQCYSPSRYNEDTKSYGFRWLDTGELQSEYSYRSAEVLGMTTTNGQVDYYTGGGYYVDLIWSTIEMKAKFAQLKDEMWIDRRTRAVIVEFAAYNAYVNLFAVVQLTFEFPPSSGILTSSSIRPVKLYHYEEMWALKLLCEVIFCMFILVFTFKECRNFIRQGIQKYFLQIWNYVELSITVYSYIAFFVYFNLRFMEISISKTLNETNGNAFINFRKVVVWYYFFNALLAFITFFATIKFVKLLRFNFHMSIVLDTLHALSSQLAWFCFMVVVTFIAYWSFFYLSLAGSAASAMSILLGQFDMRQLSNSNSVLGSVFYFLYIFTMSMVLLKLGVALLLNMTKLIKRDVIKRSRDYELLDRMFDKCRIMLLGQRRRHERLPMTDQWKDVSVLAALENRVELLYAKINKLDNQLSAEEIRLRRKMTIKISD